MDISKQRYYEKRGKILVNNLKSRHFDAYYCATKEEALATALSLMPEGSSVGWGGAMSCEQIGLMDAIRSGNYKAFDREYCQPEDRERLDMDCLGADFFLTGANGLSLTGEMVNIDGTGNRVAAIVYGPKNVIVVAGMNKVEDTLESAITRARTVAAPMNQQRFLREKNPCTVTGSCADCKSETCICNQILVTRHCRPVGRIKFILVGEELGL